MVIAALKAGSSAYGLTIVPTWDSSITTNPSAAAITNGIMFAIRTLESDLNNNLTVNIDFVDSTSVGLGENETWYTTVLYSSYLSALKASATSVNDMNAISQLPNSSTDPVVGNSQIDLQLPLARHFGLASGYGPDGFDGTVYLNVPLMNLSRPGADPTKYDLVSVTLHEMDEVLGFVSTLPGNYPSGPIGPMDLFRYQTNASPPYLARTYTTSGDNAYFSVDGTNLYARFNQNSGGDYHDWWSYTALWAPPGTTPYPQVQDAYAYPGTAPDLGSNELAGLDIIGYTLASSKPTLKITAASNGNFTLSWFPTSQGYVLQQTTNVLTGPWVSAPSHSTNWVVISATPAHEFYRLAETLPPAPALPAGGMNSAPLQQVRHVYLPRP